MLTLFLLQNYILLLITQLHYKSTTLWRQLHTFVHEEYSKRVSVKYCYLNSAEGAIKPEHLYVCFSLNWKAEYVHFVRVVWYMIVRHGRGKQSTRLSWTALKQHDLIDTSVYSGMKRSTHLGELFWWKRASVVIRKKAGLRQFRHGESKDDTAVLWQTSMDWDRGICDRVLSQKIREVLNCPKRMQR